MRIKVLRSLAAPFAALAFGSQFANAGILEGGSVDCFDRTSAVVSEEFTTKVAHILDKEAETLGGAELLKSAEIKVSMCEFFYVAYLYQPPPEGVSSFVRVGSQVLIFFPYNDFISIEEMPHFLMVN